VELLLYDFKQNSITFKNRDGVGTTFMLEFKTDLPMVEDYKLTIEAVLGEAI